jgi:hypothetical protein
VVWSWQKCAARPCARLAREVRYIIKLDLRRFAPTYAAVGDIANRLLAVRGAN